MGEGLEVILLWLAVEIASIRFVLATCVHWEIMKMKVCACVHALNQDCLFFNPQLAHSMFQSCPILGMTTGHIINCSQIISLMDPINSLDHITHRPYHSALRRPLTQLCPSPITQCGTEHVVVWLEFIKCHFAFVTMNYTFISLTDYITLGRHDLLAGV